MLDASSLVVTAFHVRSLIAELPSQLPVRPVGALGVESHGSGLTSRVIGELPAHV